MAISVCLALRLRALRVELIISSHKQLLGVLPSCRSPIWQNFGTFAQGGFRISLQENDLQDRPGAKRRRFCHEKTLYVRFAKVQNPAWESPINDRNATHRQNARSDEKHFLGFGSTTCKMCCILAVVGSLERLAAFGEIGVH